MNEVSCRAIECFFPALEAMHIPADRLVEDLPVGLESVQDPGSRIDWDTHIALLQRAEALLGRETLQQVGERAIDASPLLPVRAIGVLLPDPRQLYRLACRWVGPSFFTNVRYACDELEDGRLRLQIRIPEDYQGSPEFFEVTLGSLRAAPRLLGLGPAEVEARIDSHHAVFLIRVPARRSPLAWLKRLARLPAAARATVEALASGQQQLNQAWQEVARSRAAAEPGGETLDTVDRLGRQLVRQLGAADLPDQVLGFLVERFGWRGASLWMGAPEDDRLLFFGRSGRCSGEPSRGYALAVSGRTVGRLDVWESGAPPSEADRKLLTTLLPWVAVSVLNARLAASRDVASPFRWSSKTGRDLFVILDASAHILYVGPRSDELLGYRAEELVEQEITELVHPDDWTRLAGEFDAIRSSASSALYSTARVRCSDGSWRPLEGVAIKVLSEGGADVYLVSCGDAAERPTAH